MAHNLDPRVALEAAPDAADLRARAIAGDPVAMMTLLESFQADAASAARAIDWLYGLAIEHRKLEVAQRIDWSRRDFDCRRRGIGAGE